MNIAILQHPQQFGLKRKGEFANFIEEQRAVISHFELAAAVADRPGKGPFDVSEQLAFRHAFRQRRAVEIDQRIHRTGRGFVDRFRHQLFTGAGLSEDQHVQIRRGDNLNLFFELRHAWRKADHFGVCHLLKRRRATRKNILALQLFYQQGVVQRPGRQRSNQP